MTDLLNYLTEAEQGEYKDCLEKIKGNNAEGEEFYDYLTRRNVLISEAQQRYITSLVDLENTIEQARADVIYNIRSITREEYESKITKTDTGKTFKGNANIFSHLLTALNENETLTETRQRQIIDLLCSGTKDGFIEYLKASTTAYLQYQAVLCKHGEKAANDFINEFDEFIEAWAGEQYSTIQVKQPKEVGLGIDKFTSQVLFADWLDKPTELHGQREMIPVKMEGDQYPKELTLYFDISYPENLPQAERKLSPTDRRIYNASYWLQQTNQSNIMTYTQIFKAAKFGDRPNTKQLERIKKSIDKMRGSMINWDNTQEAQAYKKDKNDEYLYHFEGYLYPAEIIEKRQAFNGQIAEVYVKLLKDLPLMEFSKRHGQFAIIPANILETKLRLTDTTIAMQDYLIKRIERDRRALLKKDKLKKGTETYLKIVYATLYDQTGATTRQKQRTQLPNMFIYLDELKAKGYIVSYKEDTDKKKEPGVIIKYRV